MDNVYFIILILVFIIYFINHMLNKGDKKKNIMNLDRILSLRRILFIQVEI